MIVIEWRRMSGWAYEKKINETKKAREINQSNGQNYRLNEVYFFFSTSYINAIITIIVDMPVFVLLFVVVHHKLIHHVHQKCWGQKNQLFVLQPLTPQNQFNCKCIHTPPTLFTPKMSLLLHLYIQKHTKNVHTLSTQLFHLDISWVCEYRVHILCIQQERRFVVWEKLTKSMWNSAMWILEYA